MRILILTDSYPPEVRSAAQLMYDLAVGLKNSGHTVTVATSYPGYNLAEGAGKVPKDTTEEGVRVLRIKTLPHHKVNFIIRGISQLSMPWIFFFAIKKYMKEQADVVYVHSPPLPLYLTAWKLKKKWRAKFVLNVQDIFPQNAVDLGIMNQKPLVWFFERMEQKAYRVCDSIVTPSGEHKRFLTEKRGVPGNKIHVAEHWVDLDSFRGEKTGRFRRKFGLQNEFVFVFGGVTGPSQGLDIFIRVAEKLKHIRDIHFLFVGDGSDKIRLQMLARSKHLSNVLFQPFISPKEYPDMLLDMDVAIFSLTNKNTTPAVPAKLMGYMATGMPVLGLLHRESEAIKMIHEAQCGLADVYGDDALAEKLVEQMYREKDKLPGYAKNAQAYAKTHFDKSVVIPGIEKFITQ